MGEVTTRQRREARPTLKRSRHGSLISVVVRSWRRRSGAPAVARRARSSRWPGDVDLWEGADSGPAPAPVTKRRDPA